MAKLNYDKKKWYEGSEAYNKLLEKQGYVCGMCKRKVKLVIHHNHMTGKVKGLLCNACNSTIWALKNNYSRMDENRKKFYAAMIYSGYKIKYYSSKKQINEICKEIDWWRLLDNIRLKY